MRAPEDTESGLRRTIDVIRRRWLLILFHVVLAAGIGIGLSQLGQDEYEASSTLLFRQSNLSAAIFGNDFFERQEDPLVQASTNVGLVSQPVVSTRVSAALDGALSPSELQDMITASQDGDSDLVTVTATSPDPSEAQAVANAWAEEFVTFRREADQRQITEAIGLVQTELQATQDRGDETTELRQLLAQLDQGSRDAGLPPVGAVDPARAAARARRKDPVGFRHSRSNCRCVPMHASWVVGAPRTGRTCFSTALSP